MDSRPSLRALIVDDQTIFREMLAEILSTGEVCTVVGQHRTGASALADVARLSPDLIVLDLILSDMNGLDVLREVRRARRPPRVLIVTACELPPVVRNAVAEGAHGFVCKGAPLSELRLAVQRVCAGGTYFCAIASDLLRQSNARDVDAVALTDRERRILQRVAAGATSKEIASELGISMKTVLNHRQNIMNKLGIHDVAGLTRFALTYGFIGTLDS